MKRRRQHELSRDSQRHEKALAEDVSIHIFTVSASMLGVCVTVIGLIRVAISLRHVDTYADDLIALDALFFLAACLLSYWALRTRNRRRMHSLERIADVLFIGGMGILAASGVFIAYMVAVH